MDDFISKMKNFLDKSVEVSKTAIGKAGEKVQDFGDKSVLRIEIAQLESQVKKQIQELGLAAYEKLSKGEKGKITATDEDAAKILVEISRLKTEMETREKKLESAKK